MAIRTRCIRPYDYEDIRLFVPREGYEEILDVLRLFLDDRGGKRRRLMVYGERGVGKSITVRAAIHELWTQRKDFFPVIVGGEGLNSVKELLCALAEELSKQVNELFPKDKDLLKETSYLKQLIRSDEITRGTFFKWGSEIESGVHEDFGLLGFIKLTLGIRGTISEEAMREETSKITIDNRFRLQLLESMLEAIGKRRGKEPLVFVDNLDQLGEEDPKVVRQLLRALMSLDTIAIVTTVRSEFVSVDISREHRTPIRLEELKREQLMEILERRLQIDCRESRELREAGILDLSQELTRKTGNPLAFLCWLEYLCNKKDLRVDRCWDNLKGYVLTLYGIRAENVEHVAKWFFSTKEPEAKATTLISEVGLDESEVKFLEEHYVLVPDDVTRSFESKHYHLSPLLMFLKPLE
jgi:Cdc6-like AAA superfamily ATPase